MNIVILSLFVLLGFVAGSPEPQYRESIHPYYYGYPGQTSYVYRPSLEDDEEPSAPLERARQDTPGAVSSLLSHSKTSNGKKKVGRERASTSVGETGSAAQAEDRPGDAGDLPTIKDKPSSSSSAVKLGVQGVVNPPAFPPRRPAPTAKPVELKEKEKVTDEDEDEDDEDEVDTQEDEDEDEEEEDDEERRRKETLNVELPQNVTSEVVNMESKVNQTQVGEGTRTKPKTKPTSTATTSNTKAKTEAKTTTVVKPVKSTGVDALKVNKNKNKVVASPNAAAVPKEPENESGSDENGSSEGVEALVPGYVTDQGEVLVPVDTVTGDQPISIVPDPYSPPARGVPLRTNYVINSIPSPGYNSAPVPIPATGRYSFRQEFGNGESFGPVDDEEEDEEDDAEDEDEEDEEEKEEEEAAVVEDKNKNKNTKNKNTKTPGGKPSKKVPLGLIPASAPTNEDDELDAANRFRSSGPAYYAIDTRRFPPSRSPVLYPLTFQFNDGYVTGPFNEPMESAEVAQYIRPQVVRRVPSQPQPQRRRPVTPAYYNSPFYSYYGAAAQSPLQSSAEQGMRHRVRPPMQYTPYSSYQSPVLQTVGPYGGGYSQRPAPYNQVRLYTRRPYYTPRPLAYTLPKRPYGPRPTYSMEQYVPAEKVLTKLRNPGDRLKISSSYELLVEPQDYEYSQIRTRPRRPIHKNRVVIRTKTTPATRPIYQQRPVQVIPAPYRPQPQQQLQQSPVFYRPVYNVEPQQRVTVSGQFIRPNTPPAPYQSSNNLYNNYREFIKGLLSGYYGGRPGGLVPAPTGFNRPTPVIKMKNDLPFSVSSSSSSSTSAGDDSSASSSASSETVRAPVAPVPSKMSRADRNSRKSRLDVKKKTKKVKKSKKVTDPLNILKKINNKNNM